MLNRLDAVQERDLPTGRQAQQKFNSSIEADNKIINELITGYISDRFQPILIRAFGCIAIG